MNGLYARKTVVHELKKEHNKEFSTDVVTLSVKARPQFFDK